MISTIASLAIASSFLGQSNARIYESAISNGPGGDWLQDQSPFIEANGRPDGTNEVQFYFQPDNRGPGELWIWRVNVTEISVPDATNSSIHPSPIGPDPRIVNTVFDLQWPNSTANLDQTIEALQQDSSSPKQPLCASILASPSWPDVTNKYQDSDNGTCVNAIGAACAAALLATYAPASAGECGTFAGFGQIEGCQDVFGNLLPVDSLTVSLSSGNINASVNGSTPLEGYPLHSGYAFFSHSDVASPIPNSTALAQAESQLQILLLKGPGISQLLCMRVNTIIDDNTVSVHRNEKKPKPSATSGTSTNAASVSTGAVGTVVGVAGLLIFFGLL